MSDDLLQQEILWVKDNAQLESLCEAWEQKPLLALDTEFMRSRTYYPIAGLIQVNDGERNALIDPTAITDFFPFVELLDNPNVIKVLHSCSEDLEVFQHALGCLPKNLLDTQIAGAMCGHGFSVGFGNLVSQVLKADLPKGETRSDWMQRPLSQSQIHYAALDVEYLFPLATSLMAKLEEKQRLTWALDDSAAMVDNFFDNQDPDRGHLRFKSAWKLSARQLATLKSLSRWREDEAQANNIPRNRMLKDTAMFGISQKAPTQLAQLRTFEGMSERMVRSYGEQFLHMVEAAQGLPEAELPATLPRPLHAHERDILASLKAEVAKIAESLGVANEVLMRKRDYEALLFAARDGVYALPKTLQGWRQSVVGDTMVAMVKELNEAADSAAT